MLVLKPGTDAVLHAVGVFRAKIAALREIVEHNRELASLMDWLPALNAKVDAFAAAVLTETSPTLTPWPSGEFAQEMRTESRVTEALARELLAHFAVIQTEANAVIEALAKQRPATEPLLRVLGAVVGDFVSVQSAIYGRFPHLEEGEGTGQ